MHRAQNGLRVVGRVVTRSCFRKGMVTKDYCVRRWYFAVKDPRGISRLPTEGQVWREMALGTKNGPSWRNVVTSGFRGMRLKVFEARRGTSSLSAEESADWCNSRQQRGFFAVCCVCIMCIMTNESLSLLGMRTAWTWVVSRRGLGEVAGHCQCCGKKKVWCEFLRC